MQLRSIAAGLFGIALFLPVHVSAFMLTNLSDLITDSRPNTPSSHTIQFTLNRAIPASGSFVIEPITGAFSFPDTFDPSYISFSVFSGGDYVPQVMGTAVSDSENAASINSSNGNVTIALNSTSGLLPGDRIRVTIASSTAPEVNPVNAGVVGSYKIRIETKDASGIQIDEGTTMIAIVNPVTTAANIIQFPPVISNGLPTGHVPAGSSQIELSLETDQIARCRYATSSGIAYSSMKNSFEPNIGQLFYTTLGGFQDGTSYTFYVRCISVQGIANDTDYPITFELDPTPTDKSSNPSSGSGGTGGSSSGTRGIGQYMNGSSVLYLGTVTITGYTVPGGTVTVLKDGMAGATARSDGTGKFTATVSDLERGVYSFGIYATDGEGRKTASYAPTLTVNSGTNNNITGVVLSPTIQLAANSVGVGAPAQIVGQSIPGTQVEVKVEPQSGDGNSRTYTATSSLGVAGVSDGAWKVTVPAADLSQGVYMIKVRAIQSTQSISDYSQTLLLGVGVKAPSLLLGDLNNDGKVNLVDFSIMLSMWNKKNTIADLNADGTVNLADFSILLFNWTG